MLMETTLRQTRRKVIDLNLATFHSLSQMAAGEGTNLKHFIEMKLNELVEDFEDATTYRQLCESEPQGLQAVSEEEQADFEAWLGV